MNSPTQIKQTRLDAGLSMADLAELIGVTRMTIHSWESGRHPIKPRDFDYMQIKLTQITCKQINNL